MFNRVFCMAITALCMMANVVLAQFVVSGKVSDAQSNETLAGANIILIGSNQATSSRLEGGFEFRKVKAGNYRIKVSYVGYETFEQQVAVNEDIQLHIELTPSTRMTDEVIVRSTRASEKTATTFNEVSAEELEKLNLGQDIPFLLNFTPSAVTTSDAGAGVGYTGIRIRGSDPTRINVTVNGIPLNDAESHGVFWVNMPDFASSVDNLQIQRGVGTSTNGAAAFGASMNIQTTGLNKEAYGQIDNSFGSFNTRRHTVQAGTGLINDKFAFDIRLSNIYSDGYVDRAFSDLKSYFISGGYYGDNTLVKINVFAGAEQTYQSWAGVDEETLKTNRTFNAYTYDNETDNYQQDHYQLIVAHDINSQLTLNGALHYTYGRGYYEQFRTNDRLEANYGIDPIIIGDSTIARTDIIRRRWLDNHFGGFTFSADYRPSRKTNLILGGGYNIYDGDHFGEIIWMRVAGSTNIRDRYYDNNAVKKDFNIYAKVFHEIGNKLSAFGDIQYRRIDYNYAGVNNNLMLLDGEHEFNFFNPKAGLSYKPKTNTNIYASYAISNREPVRRDFVDNIPFSGAPINEAIVPKPETLHNLEIGYEQRGNDYNLAANYYFMGYNNQLVLTGELNDVGAPIRTNVDRSFRTGIELQGGIKVNNSLDWQGNITLSQNKILNFEEIVYTYDEAYEQLPELTLVNEYEMTDISFSPNLIGASVLTYKPLAGMEIAWQSKYVGRQYLDNTGNTDRSLNPYWVNDLRIAYSWRPEKYFKEIGVNILLNNIFNNLYESNGFVFTERYASGTPGNYSVTDPVAYNYFYPQAGFNFLAGLSLKF